ncbi:MAG: hypothetical protein WBP61_08905 [Nocardioides sp.]
MLGALSDPAGLGAVRLIPEVGMEWNLVLMSAIALAVLVGLLV